MKNIVTDTDLNDAIVQLKGKWVEEGQMVKEQFHLAVDSVKPINLIKSTFKEAVASRDLKHNIVKASVGLTAGYLSKMALAGVMKTPFTKLLGKVLMFGVTTLVARKSETVKSVGKGLVKMIRGKRAGKSLEADNTKPR